MPDIFALFSSCNRHRNSTRETVCMANCYFAGIFRGFAILIRCVMRDLAVVFLHLVVTVVRLAGPRNIQKLDSDGAIRSTSSHIERASLTFAVDVVFKRFSATFSR